MATNASTSKPDVLIAEMYERWTLDCVIGLANGIAVDFINRPRQYKDVTAAIATNLQDLWFLSETDPNYPGPNKRKMIFEALIGPSDRVVEECESQFHAAAAAVRERARAYSERQVTTGEAHLRQAFQDAASTFYSYLRTLTENRVVILGNKQTNNIFEKSVEILKSNKVTAVFGRPPTSEKDWPLRSKFEGDGARVIEEVSKTLDTPVGKMSQNDFIVTQRIASYGADTIRLILTKDPQSATDKELEGFIREAYRWKTALDARVPNVVKK